MLLNPYRFAASQVGGSYDYPYIRGVFSASTPFAGAGSVVISYNAAPGDLILVVLAAKSSSIPTPTFNTSGWTLLASHAPAGSLKDFVWYKTASGTESGCTVSWTGGNYTCSAAGYVIQANTFQGAPEFAVGGFDSNMNPANLIPSWGSAKTLWIAQGSFNYPYPSAPASWPLPSNQRWETNGTANGSSTVLLCADVLVAASRDPVAFASGTLSWGIPRTLAIRPKPSVG